MNNNSRPIRVMVVDDHAMVRQGLATFLDVYDDLELTGEASNGLEAVENCKKILPDVVLMDILLPELDGVSAIRAIRKSCPSVQIVALSSYKDEALVVNALQAGAVGYVLKNVSADDLARTIRTAHTGHLTLSPEASQVMIHAATQVPIPGYDLTDRERSVLALMIEGLNNGQIANRLVVSPSTIKSHVSNILAKLNATCRTEAVAIAVRYGLIA